MVRCIYCKKLKSELEAEDMRICADSPDEHHHYTTKGYNAGYAFADMCLDKLAEIFRFLFKRK